MTLQFSVEDVLNLFSLSSDDEIQIEKDIPRTFSTFSDDSFRSSLKNILFSYCHLHPDMGYCQALSIIGGALLVVYGDEESSFFHLLFVVERVLPSFFSKEMTGVKIDCFVFERLVSKHLPLLFRHFSQIKASFGLVFARYSLKLFIDVFPVIEATFRIWDVLFVDHAFVFALSLAILKSEEKELLRLYDEVEVIVWLEERMEERFDVAPLIRLAKEYRVKNEEIAVMR